MNDPFTELMGAAVQLHELFVSYMNAGFTEEQAMTLVISQLSTHAHISAQEKRDDI